ncbi:MAG: hypothetical protein WBC70_06845 [Candidatus Aminicenantales bacterium]
MRLQQIVLTVQPVLNRMRANANFVAKITRALGTSAPAGGRPL